MSIILEHVTVSYGRGAKRFDAARNVSLRLKVQSAAGRFSALNDQALRRIGADLHDGPAQLMGYSFLRSAASTGAPLP